LGHEGRHKQGTGQRSIVEGQLNNVSSAACTDFAWKLYPLHAGQYAPQVAALVRLMHTSSGPARLRQGGGLPDQSFSEVSTGRHRLSGKPVHVTARAYHIPAYIFFARMTCMKRCDFYFYQTRQPRPRKTWTQPPQGAFAVGAGIAVRALTYICCIELQLSLTASRKLRQQQVPTISLQTCIPARAVGLEISAML
jgi:hypothetical protein